MTRFAVAACPQTPGQAMSPAAAMTGSELLVWVGDAVTLAEFVAVGDAVGLEDPPPVGEVVGPGALAVPVGVALTQCGLCGFGRRQGVPPTEVGKLSNAAMRKTTRPPPAACRSWSGVRADHHEGRASA
jgi:hypothetical protein